MKISMKILSAVMPLMMSPVMSVAQESNDNLMNIRGDKGNLRIEIAGFGITLGEDQPYETGSGRRRHGYCRASIGLLDNVDFGFNVLMDVKYKDLWQDVADAEPLSLYNGKSNRFAFDIVNLDVRLAKWLSFGTGINFTADSYRLSSGYGLTSAEGKLMPIKLDDSVWKSKFTATYIDIPVRLAFMPVGDWTIVAEGSAGVLMKAHSKFKSPKEKHALPGFNPIRVTVGGAISYDWFGVFCNYTLTPLFKDAEGADSGTLTMGVRFNLGF